MAVRRRNDIVFIVMAVAAIVAYASVRSEYRLKSQMPVEFFDPLTPTPARVKTEKRVAEAYWRCAVTQIQWEYGYARRLPAEAPVNFTIRADEAGALANDPVLRARYWQRLREAWDLPSSWQHHYEWSTISLTDSLRAAGQWLEGTMRRLTGYSW